MLHAMRTWGIIAASSACTANAAHRRRACAGAKTLLMSEAWAVEAATCAFVLFALIVWFRAVAPKRWRRAVCGAARRSFNIRILVKVMGALIRRV